MRKALFASPSPVKEAPAGPELGAPLGAEGDVRRGLSFDEVDRRRSISDTGGASRRGGHAEGPLQRTRSSTAPGTGGSQKRNSAAQLGRSLSGLQSSPSSKADGGREGEARRVPKRKASDPEMGLASRLPRQASVCGDHKQICDIAEVKDGEAGLQDGTYLFVVMVSDPEHIRLIHEDFLVIEGALAGHSSLVERSEFIRNWTQQWDAGDNAFRHTVLYAGELDYKEGIGVLSWNNRSGHYLPDSEAHVRVALDPATFVPFD